LFYSFSLINRATTVGSYHENAPSEDAPPLVKIKNLVKRYKGRPVNAVDGLSFTFNKNQITALLGHNGAGKSSLLGTLTGLLTPTSGDCFVDGMSITKNTFQARQMIGFCPQDNVLFDKLTVYEHIEFYFRIKGKTATEDAVIKLAQEVGLGDFISVRSHALSGGNKRKLCMAMALSGDEKQKLLIFDEPTSGMGT
jgi:ABC-type multidrug transport system ATPase subunit